MKSMKIYNKFMRNYFTRHYIHKSLAREKLAYKKKLNAPNLSSNERDRIEWDFYNSMRELDEWLTAIEDAERINQAKKMDIFLSDFPLPEEDKDDIYAVHNSYFYYGSFGEKLLYPDICKQLRNAIYERRSTYMQEQAEKRQFWANTIISIFSLMIALAAILIK